MLKRILIGVVIGALPGGVMYLLSFANSGEAASARGVIAILLALIGIYIGILYATSMKR